MDRDGRLHLDSPRVFAVFVRTLAQKSVEVIVRKRVRHRTTPQLGYYWSTVIPTFAHHEGYRRDEHYMLHDGLMHKFWPVDPDPLTSSPRRRRLRLHDQGTGEPLSDEEMGIHIEQVVIFAAERGCVIPDADKHYREARKEQAA